jgi:predicted SAM-dependent methyltransferase
MNNQPETFGIDIQDLPGVDLVADLNEKFPIPDNTFDFAIAKDFLEHIDQKKCIQMMEEIYRILKPGGHLIFDVPSTDGNNMGAFQDPTHVSFWNQNKFWYFLDEKYGKGFRTLYNIRCWFIPRELQTYYNEWNITYVRGILEKQA